MSAQPPSFFEDAAFIAAPFVAMERTKETARQAAHNREQQRHRGVCYSGMGPGPFRGRSDAEILADAQCAANDIAAFRSSPEGRAQTAQCQAEEMAGTLLNAVLGFRNAMSRGSLTITDEALACATEAEAVCESLMAQVRAMATAARSARGVA